jgi:hypothetical protein
LGTHRRPICGLGWGRGAAGGCAPWHSQAAAAGSSRSGEGAARSEPHVTQGGVEDPRDKVGAVGRWWHELDPRARRWGAKSGAAVSASGARRGRARGGTVAQALYRGGSPIWSKGERWGDTRGQEQVRRRAARAGATGPACACLGTRRGQRGLPRCLGVCARLGRSAA